jgi:hypothetical protein
MLPLTCPDEIGEVKWCLRGYVGDDEIITKDVGLTITVESSGNHSPVFTEVDVGSI